MIGKIQNKKKKHESSWKLAKLLIKKDRSWEKTHTKPDIGIISFGETEGSESEKEGVVGKKEEKKGNNDNVNPLPFPTTPLLIATSTGIEEIVNGILKEHPQAVEHVSDEGLNIMHVAIRHRQRNIFKRVKKMKILMVRLVRKIDDNGYTLLHHVSDMTHYYSSGSLPNAALQLQDELKWFERVRKIIPSHYEMNHRKVNGQTAEDMFEKSHAELHKEAQSWLKRTSESSSVIAVLIATVAFTAAYTVPGGSDQLTGHPIPDESKVPSLSHFLSPVPPPYKKMTPILKRKAPRFPRVSPPKAYIGLHVPVPIRGVHDAGFLSHRDSDRPHEEAVDNHPRRLRRGFCSSDRVRALAIPSLRGVHGDGQVLSHHPEKGSSLEFPSAVIVLQ
ncbi:ankyrin repeat-containing protein NPR4-like [Ziziphus jujuba]|uniref:Ankyrin repeat-containing protein NPR4-like n=1 Tax=Ziziphus jujuba TaxID=326968 RepID=A0ABM4A9D0_ZIZJJ|nr:ankyrin repeat-containing protein NPR4-like [Ziziphus jujuba]